MNDNQNTDLIQYTLLHNNGDHTFFFKLNKRYFKGQVISLYILKCGITSTQGMVQICTNMLALS